MTFFLGRERALKKLMIAAMALAVLSVPAVSSACHVTEVVGEADCNGWSLCTTVYFTSSADSGSLAYTVTILDGSGEEVTSFGETLTITHEPGEGYYEFCYDGVWEGEHQVTDATVVLTSALDGQDPTTFTFDLDCTVDSDHVSLGALKAQYR